VNKPKDHLIVGILFAGMAGLLGYLAVWTGWSLDYLAGFFTAIAVYELEVYIAAKRWFPKLTASVLRGKKQDIEAINSTLITHPTIFEEMGGMP